MRRVYILFFVSLLLIGVSLYLAVLLKQRTISSFKSAEAKISVYSQWGYDVSEFEKMYLSLVKQVESTPFIFLPFQVGRLTAQQDSILRLTQTGYATEITKQKELLQARLTYLRERVKNDSVLLQQKKQTYFNEFDAVAVEVFEKNSDITQVKSLYKELLNQDEKITKEIEQLKTEALLSEIKGYKDSCESLYLYFDAKNSIENKQLAAACINEANTISPSRERVFTLMQSALQQKQKIIQQEQYALELKKKEEERLSIIPPSPKQEGKLILVNLQLQRLYAYENGRSIFAAAVPITTGKYGFETVTGEFAIFLKKEQHKMVSPFPGIFYDDVVNYWMPFYLGYGLHDAPWRAVYGTQDYPVVGSHGCVNMPLNETIVLYNWAEVGTKVIVM